MTNWNIRLVEQIAGAIKRQRESSTPKITAAELSRRTAELGLPISRAVISDLETGRKRTLDVSELIVLARALGVPPLQLIYPNLPDGVVEAWPGAGLPEGSGLSSFRAAQWFSGEADEMYPGSAIVLSRHFEAAQRRLRRARLDLTIARGTGNSAQIDNEQRNIDYWVEEVAAQAIELTRAGLTVNIDRLPEQVRERVAGLRQIEDPDDA